MNINYAAHWIKNAQPFEIEIGEGVLSKEHKDQSLRITETGQIVMKGRANERSLLAKIRAEFEKEAGIIHKYGKEDDEFFFVIGYLKPDIRLQDINFRKDLEKCLEKRKSCLSLAMKVDRVKIILYQNYSLDETACLWESKDFPFQKELNLSQKNLADTISEVIKGARLYLNDEEKMAM